MHFHLKYSLCPKQRMLGVAATLPSYKNGPTFTPLRTLAGPPLMSSHLYCDKLSLPRSRTLRTIAQACFKIGLLVHQAPAAQLPAALASFIEAAHTVETRQIYTDGFFAITATPISTLTQSPAARRQQVSIFLPHVGQKR